MAFDEGDWARFLSRELGFAVRVRFGRARQRVLEARPLRASRDHRELDVRMSAFFGEAPPEVRAAVARWLRVGRRAKRAAELLDGWIAQSVVNLPPPTHRTLKLCAAGRHHDLAALALELAEGGDWLPELDPWPRITWGRSTGSRPRYSLQLGSYVTAENLIRIHPVLDRDWVPAWFVRYVLFHELLHAAVPPAKQGRRTLHHGAEFRRQERAYADFARAQAWQEQNLPLLLRDARRKSERFEVPAQAVREPPPARSAERGQGLLFAPPPTPSDGLPRSRVAPSR